MIEIYFAVKAILLTGFAYFVISRFHSFYQARKFYGSQEGVLMGEEDYPLIGTAFPLLR
jgi:hypothetical protein